MSATKRGECGRCAAQEVEKRYIVEWTCKGVEVMSPKFPNLARARGYAKEFRENAQKYIDSGSDKDGSMAAAVKSVKICKVVKMAKI